jgi:hypothetical protein
MLSSWRPRSTQLEGAAGSYASQMVAAVIINIARSDIAVFTYFIHRTAASIALSSLEISLIGRITCTFPKRSITRMPTPCYQYDLTQLIYHVLQVHAEVSSPPAALTGGLGRLLLFIRVRAVVRCCSGTMKSQLDICSIFYSQPWCVVYLSLEVSRKV